MFGPCGAYYVVANCGKFGNFTDFRTCSYFSTLVHTAAETKKNCRPSELSMASVSHPLQAKMEERSEVPQVEQMTQATSKVYGCLWPKPSDQVRQLSLCHLAL